MLEKTKNLLHHLIKKNKLCDSCGSREITQIHFQDRDEENWALRNLVLFCEKCFFEYNAPLDFEPEFKGGYISDVKTEQQTKLKEDGDKHGIAGDFNEMAVESVKFYSTNPKVKKNGFGEVVGIYDSIED